MADTYDPLVANRIPLNHQQACQSYWQAHTAPVRLARANLPKTTQFLIVGAGYTGLNAALELAEQGMQDITVIDAGDVGAGASGRNAGFVLPTTGRLGFTDYARRYGETVAHQVQDELSLAVQRVRHFAAGEPDCQWQPGPYLRFAHHPRQAARLAVTPPQYQPTPFTARWLPHTQCQQQWPGLAGQYGALELTPAASVNPLALSRRYAARAIQAGVKLITGCAMLSWQEQARGVEVTTTQGVVTARQLLLTTNAYLPAGMSQQLGQQQLPVLSAIGVTAPLTREQLAATGLQVGQLMMDTRLLKHYYRLLPDRRLLFGGRGAVSGAAAARPRPRQQLSRALGQTFPALARQPLDYHWWGWVSVSADSVPRVFSHSRRVQLAAGYCGAGVAFTALAGQRLAHQTLGYELPTLPFYESPLPRYPLPHWRRLGQRILYTLAR